jgi:alpha-glucosidase
MRWDGSALAGFTSGVPWLPLDQPAGINVASQRDDPTSMLSLCRELLQLRRAEPALNLGEWRHLGHAGSAIAYLRMDVEPGGRRFLVCLNLAGQPSPIPAEATSLRGTILVSTLNPEGRGRFEGRSDLAADEGLVIRLD